MGETSSLIQIKGIRDGLLVTLTGAAWPDLVKVFIENIEDRSAFFQGGRVALDVGPQELRVAELSRCATSFPNEVALWAVLSESTLTERTAQNLGLATRISKPLSWWKFHKWQNCSQQMLRNGSRARCVLAAGLIIQGMWLSWGM